MKFLDFFFLCIFCVFFVFGIVVFVSLLVVVDDCDFFQLVVESLYVMMLLDIFGFMNVQFDGLCWFGDQVYLGVCFY